MKTLVFSLPLKKSKLFLIFFLIRKVNKNVVIWFSWVRPFFRHSFLSMTELNNSVKDYNSSRVGVVCRRVSNSKRGIFSKRLELSYNLTNKIFF